MPLRAPGNLALSPGRPACGAFEVT